MFTLGRFRHQFNKARMYQHTRDGNRQRHIGFKFDGGRSRDHQRQEEESTVTNHIQNG